MPILPVKSWRDLGREGTGRHFGAGSPFARNGIFIMSSQKQGQVTREAGPGITRERLRETADHTYAIVQPHSFIEANWLCVTCHMMREGHDRLMEKNK